MKRGCLGVVSCDFLCEPGLGVSYDLVGAGQGQVSLPALFSGRLGPGLGAKTSLIHHSLPKADEHGRSNLSLLV